MTVYESVKDMVENCYYWQYLPKPVQRMLLFRIQVGIEFAGDEDEIQ